MKIGFIGAGNLAGSIIKGLSNDFSEKYEIYVFDVIQEKARFLQEEYPVKASNFAETVQEAETLILAVKPKDIPKLLEELKQYNLDHKLIITVAAGISLGYYEEVLPDMSFVRVMPNTSSAVLHSMSGLARGKKVNDEQAQQAETIFSALGHILWLSDSKINALTAVSGSGPAYIYLFAECMSKAGNSLGLSAEEAEILTRETIVGAGKMMAESGKSPQELRLAVTSPNGTTYEALRSFESDGLEEIVRKAMKACWERAQEMEEELQK